MSTVTLQIDSQIAERGEAIARHRDISLSSLVEALLDQLAHSETETRAQQAEHLIVTLRQLSRPMGGKPWTDRNQLHER